MIFTDPEQCGTETRQYLTTLIAAGWRFEGCEFHQELNKLVYHFQTPNGVRGLLDWRTLQMEASIYTKETE
jgi:hypothetical protein